MRERDRESNKIIRFLFWFFLILGADSFFSSVVLGLVRQEWGLTSTGLPGWSSHRKGGEGGGGVL